MFTYFCFLCFFLSCWRTFLKCTKGEAQLSLPVSGFASHRLIEPSGVLVSLLAHFYRNARIGEEAQPKGERQ
jgi:hypothetical protein